MNENISKIPHSVSIGNYAGYNLTSGHSNILIGNNAGRDLTTETNVVIIGDDIVDLVPEHNKNALFIGDRVALGNKLFGKKVNLKDIIILFIKFGNGDKKQNIQR